MQGKIDLNDALVSPFFVLSSGVAADLFSLELFGWDFAAALFTVGSGAAQVSISTANIVAILALVIAYATNRPEFDGWKLVETWTAIVTVGLVVAPPFAPPLEALIQASPIVGLVSVIIQAGGFYALSYEG